MYDSSNYIKNNLKGSQMTSNNLKWSKNNLKLHGKWGVLSLFFMEIVHVLLLWCIICMRFVVDPKTKLLCREWTFIPPIAHWVEWKDHCNGRRPGWRFVAFSPFGAKRDGGYTRSGRWKTTNWYNQQKCFCYLGLVCSFCFCDPLLKAAFLSFCCR